MSEAFTFAVDAAIIHRLGEELVARQETALIELVKNSYDADATRVEVLIVPGKKIDIYDDGSGMTRDEVVGGFLRLASDLKVRAPVSPVFKRRRAGRKGIGRFATQRLGARLLLATTPRSEDFTYILSVDWRRFTSGTTLQDVPVRLRTVRGRRPHGTCIRMRGPRDSWSETQLRRCWRGLSSLLQPFPVTDVEHAPPEHDPGFDVTIRRGNQEYADHSVVIDLQSEVLQHMHAVIELQVDPSGVAAWRLSKNRFGDATDWTPLRSNADDAGATVTHQHLRSVAMKAHYVVLKPELFPPLVFTRLRDVLSHRGGVRLYRNGFRVLPYGEPGDDWLSLDATYAKRSQTLAPIGNRNFLGVIEVRDPDGNLFNETASREGIIQSPAFQELVKMASSVLLTGVQRIAADRGRQRAASTKREPNAYLAADDNLRIVAKLLHEVRSYVGTERPEVVKALDNATSALTRASSQTRTEKQRLADEAALLRFLATLGMMMVEFAHETGMTFRAFRLDFEAVFVAVDNCVESRDIHEQARRARRMLNRMESLTGYLLATAAARSSRGMTPVSVAAAVNDFIEGMGQQAESQHIALTVALPPFEPLYTGPMHEAEVASILLNLYTNAVKAVKRSTNARQILVSARYAEQDARFIKLAVSDTGDGIPESIRGRVFDAFFTTSHAPSGAAGDAEHATGAGLGLWIVQQIVTASGGRVSIEPPEPGFATCVQVLLPAHQEAGQ